MNLNKMAGNEYCKTLQRPKKVQSEACPHVISGLTLEYELADEIQTVFVKFSRYLQSITSVLVYLQCFNYIKVRYTQQQTNKQTNKFISPQIWLCKSIFVS